MGSRGSSIGNSKVPKGWHITNFFEGIAILRPNDSKQSLSLPRSSEIPEYHICFMAKMGFLNSLEFSEMTTSRLWALIII